MVLMLWLFVLVVLAVPIWGPWALVHEVVGWAMRRRDRRHRENRLRSPW